MNTARTWLAELFFPAGAPENRRWAGYTLLIAMFAAFVMLPSITVDFLFDDFQLIVINPVIRDWRNWGELVQWGRPLRALSFVLDHALWGQYAPGFRLTNLVLYFLCAWRLFHVAHRLLGSINWALFAALFWLAMPVHVESFIVISHRKELMTLLFQLLALEWYWDRQSARWKLPAAGLAFLAAILSKQVAIALPLFLLFHEHWVRKRKGQRLPARSLLAAGLLLLIPLGGFLLGYEDLELFKYFQQHELFTEVHFNFLRTAPLVFLEYLRIALIGSQLQIDYLPAPVTSIFSLRFALPVLLLGLLGLGLWRWSRREPAVSWAAAWVVLHSLPVLNLIPQSYIMADRYFFTPSAGIALLAMLALRSAWNASQETAVLARVGRALLLIGEVILAAWVLLLLYQTIYSNIQRMMGVEFSAELSRWIFDRVKVACILFSLGMVLPILSIIHQMGLKASTQGRPFALALLFLVLTGVFTLSAIRQSEWQPPRRIWEVEVRRNPQSITAHHNLAWYAERDGDFEKAMDHYQASIRIAPELNPKGYFGMGNILLNHFQEPGAAIPYLHKAVRLDPDLVDAYNSLAVALVQTEKNEEAIQVLAALLARKPEDANGQNNLGVLLKQMGRPVEARQRFDRAVEIEPGYAKAWLNRAVLSIESGIERDAMQDIQRAIELDPLLLPVAEPYLLVIQAGKAAREAGVETGLQRLREAAARHPQSGVILLAAGRLLGQINRMDEARAAYYKAGELDPALRRFASELPSPAQP